MHTDDEDYEQYVQTLLITFQAGMAYSVGMLDIDEFTPESAELMREIISRHAYNAYIAATAPQQRALAA